MILKDNFGRFHNYLRISLVDSCNFSCTYCVPHQKPDKKRMSELMSAQEIGIISDTFISLGVDKIRLTGGEPTIRKDFGGILTRLASRPVELTLTTNGFLIDRFINELKAAGVRSLNLSIDSLKPARFQKISGFDGFAKVYANIMRLVEEGFHVKLNVVLMRDVNNDEVDDFVELSRKLPLHIRFIEFMPFTNNDWGHNKMISHREIVQHLNERYDMLKLPDHVNDTTKKYKVIGCEGTLAVISSVSEPFCSGCNRLRISATGKMRNCLFAQKDTDLLTALRNGEDILPLIRQNVQAKAAQYGGQSMSADIKNSEMLLIGG